MALQNSDLRWSDLLEIRPFPSVITGAHVKNLRDSPDSDAARDFVGGYLGFDVRSRFALQESLASLANSKNGGAFWLNGAYGSGKSHLLGLLALLCDGAQSEVFAAQFPEFRGFLTQFSPRLTIFVALDDYEAARWSLEEVFWREAQLEWARQNLGEWPDTIETAREGSRAEAFAVLQSELGARGRFGIAVFWDEISLFLGGREHRALQNDAAFTQFLGQLSARAPLWIWAALQKTVEDLGGLEPYSLGQIRDRFTLLPLSLAHLPAIVEKRLIQVKNAELLDEICEKTFENLEKDTPKLGFGPQEWRALAPFHPHTVELLEAVTGRFFSRTRSAMLFCARAADLNQSVEKRAGAEAIWDYFAPEIAAHPDLRPLEEPWNCWRDWLETVPDEREKSDLSVIARFVLLCRVAGRAVTPMGAASALELHPNGADSAQWARFLLEKLRRGAGFLALERGEDAFGDRYALDLGRRVGETARRHVLAAAQTLETPDARIGEAALRATKSGWALDELGEEGRAQSVFWRHSPRRIRVILARDFNAAHIANLVAATQTAGASQCAILLLGAPFESDFAWQNVAVLLSESRLKAAFWHWKPRPATRDEWELAREAAGAHLARLDPVLLDNRRGRAILEHIEREQPARDAALARVVTRLFCEGELVLGNGAAIEAAELAGNEDFAARLESVADFALPQVFARFERIAPRARLLVASNAETLGLELLRRPRDEPFFAPSLERLARNLGEPLGVAKPSNGRWKMAAGDADLTSEITQIVGDGATFSSLEAQMAISDWGLTSEQLEIVICAQLRAGELVAFDARGSELSAPKIGLPLRRSVHHLGRGTLPENAIWTKLASFSHQILEIAPGAAGFEQSAKISAALALWRDETQSWLELARSRVAQLRRALNQSAAQWNRFESASAVIADAIGEIRGDGAQILERAANLDAQKLAENLKIARETAQKLENAGELLAGHALLTHPDLATPPELNSSRAQILERLGEGETALFDADLRAEIQNWRADYGARYASWHSAQHDAARWNTLRRLENGDDLRALERLSTLTRRRFEAGPRLRAFVASENAKMCPRHDASQIQLAPGEATCPSCGLRWGERISLGDPKIWENETLNALESFRGHLREPAAARFLERHNAPFLEWDGAAATLWPLLTNAGLAQLDEAFAPRRRVSRSLSELKTALKGENTRGEIETAFLSWLDGGEALENDDEVEILE